MMLRKKLITFLSTRKISSHEFNALKFPFDFQIIGGKLISLDLVPENSTIISGGIGNDVEFELELIRRKKVNIIGIDPTETASKFISGIKEKDSELMKKFTYIKKGISHSEDDLKLFYGENDFMSSISAGHRDIMENNYFICKTVTIESLLEKYNDISYLKLDIEGAEYKILDKLTSLTIPQISIEFHHHCSTEYRIEDTIKNIRRIEEMGYDAIDYGSFHGYKRELPRYVSKWSDLNDELLFIKKQTS